VAKGFTHPHNISNNRSKEKKTVPSLVRRPSS